MNIITATDSYKISHHSMYPEGTERVYSYFEARKGARFDKTVFFGLQSLLKQIAGTVVTMDDLDAAEALAQAHFGQPLFNVEGWEYIIREHDGRLPLRIKAVPEGTPVTVNNVLMTVENTDPKCWWLTNAMESFLTHVWYPSTVASLSYDVKRMIERYLVTTTGSTDGVDFMLHDFGYRGAASHESASIGGAAHLVNFKGTDTLPAMELAMRDYGANLDDLAFSVPATEHSIMTSLGEHGEEDIVRRLLEQHPTGILSVVADSYDYYRFVDELVGSMFYNDIIKRDGVFVVRPDSVTHEHPTPEELVVWTLETLWGHYGGTETEQGYKVLNPHVRVLWGDGIDPQGINMILQAAMDAGFAASNLVFGMGGGLLQKVNRDTQRFAMKASAICIDNSWRDIFKRPLDLSKASKSGRMSLIKLDGEFVTVANSQSVEGDILRTVFENGELKVDDNFADIRKRATSAE